MILLFLTDIKIQWDVCLGPNITAYIYPDKNVAEVTLDDDNDVTEFPIGEYKIRRPMNSSACAYYYVVVKSKSNSIF